jgi:hypothetical protein
MSAPGGALSARFCSSGSQHHCGVPKAPTPLSVRTRGTKNPRRLPGVGARSGWLIDMPRGWVRAHDDFSSVAGWHHRIRWPPSTRIRIATSPRYLPPESMTPVGVNSWGKAETKSHNVLREVGQRQVATSSVHAPRSRSRTCIPAASAQRGSWDDSVGCHSGVRGRPVGAGGVNLGFGVLTEGRRPPGMRFRSQ